MKAVVGRSLPNIMVSTAQFASTRA